MTRKPVVLPPLQALQSIERPLTAPEYYHACIGHHPRTLIPPRDVVSVLEGELAPGSVIDWQAALNQVVAVNPGCHLRLVGKRQHARWLSDGQPPRIRFVEDCDWDGRSDMGSEFIFATPLSLEEGRTCELIIAGRDKLKIIFRATHAVMDGMGVVHFLMELFRAIRGEPLLGSNATYTDVDLMRHVPSESLPFKKITPPPLTGGAQGDARGGTWRRITLPGPQPHLLPRVALAIAKYARRQGGTAAPARIAMPVSLKRHAPELLATTNFTNMLYLDIAPHEGLENVKAHLSDLLARNIDTNYPGIIEAIRYLPFTWLDRLLSITDKNYTKPKIFETAVLSVMGPFKRTAFSGGGFRAETLYGLPQKENAFVVVVGFQGKFEVLVGMANVFASDGRLDAFLDDLQQRLCR